MNLLYSNDKKGQYPPSWYANTAQELPPFPRLKGEETADVCVIGGGYTGLSSALHLAQKGLKVVLVEAHRVGWGASGRNGGQVGTGQRLEQDDLEKMRGTAQARLLWDIAEESKALVQSLIADHSIDCAYRPGVAHADWHRRDVPHTHAYAEKLARDYGYDQIEVLDRAASAELFGTDVYKGGYLDHGAGHLHPLNFALGLARAAVEAGVVIHESTTVRTLNQGAPATVQCDQGRVKADHVVLACNGYLGGLERKISSHVMPINNFILATEPLDTPPLAKDIAVADSKFVVNYFRLSHDKRILFGGGESYGYKFPSDIKALVQKPMLEVYPQLRDARIDFAWGGTLAITINRMPCFARPGKNILSASGYSGHGVAMATMAGKIMAEAIAGQAGQFDVMANVPSPRFPGGPAMRSPLLKLAMTWYATRDRLGI